MMTLTLRVKWVLGSVIARDFGYTQEAQRKKRERGVWAEGVIWRTAPDGRIVYNTIALEEWMESGPQNS